MGTLLSMESGSDDDGLNIHVKDNFIELNLKGGGDDHFLISNSGTVNAGQWQHLAFSWGAAGMQLYLDGSLVASDGYTGGLSDIGEPLTIGANQKSSDNGQANNLEDYFDGQIDEVTFFDQAPDQTEVESLLSQGPIV